MNLESLQKEELLAVAILLMPAGMTLIQKQETLIAGAICLVLGVVSVGFRGWLKTK